MNDETYFRSQDATVAQVGERSVAAVFGWVMGLVSISLGFMTFGAYLGRDFTNGQAMVCFFVGFGMLLISSFAGQRFRAGGFAIGWLFATATFIGLGLGPALAYAVDVQQSALIQAIGGTAATVLCMGAVGMLMSKDLVSWMRPLSIIMLVTFGAIIIWSIVAGPLNPFISLVVYGLSALALLVDFNYLRKHATEADVVWLATGIFIAIVNIFTSLLNLLSD